MNNKFPQKQNTSEKLKAKQYGVAVALLALAWIIWKKSRFKIFAIIPVLLAVFYAVAAFYLLAIVWREPPWGGVISDGLTNLLNKGLGKMPQSRWQK